MASSIEPLGDVSVLELVDSADIIPDTVDFDHLDLVAHRVSSSVRISASFHHRVIASNLSAIQDIIERVGPTSSIQPRIHLRRMDYSSPQAGKARLREQRGHGG